MKRDENRVADCLANEGVAKEEEHIYWEAQISRDTDISDQCQALTNRDLQPPDGVPRREGRTRGQELGDAINGGHQLPYLHY
jgi:hypothetical protein